MMEETLTGNYETLIRAIRNFWATLLREIRKPVLKLYEFIDIMIENFTGRMK